MRRKKTILLADDHKLVRKGFSEIISQNEDYFVVAEANNGNELVKEYLNTAPDLVISDISMPDLNGIDAAKKIKIKSQNAKILFISMYCDKDHIYKAIKAGAKGLINKSSDPKTLFYAIDLILNGETYFPPYKSQSDLVNLIAEMDLKNSRVVNEDISFSSKEKRVLLLLTEGLKSKEIAEKMFLSKRTIDLYRSNLIQKLNLSSASDLMRFANQYRRDNGF